ncbi:MAG: UDP-N-acetylmuramate dehydrogenase [Armatimonadetes bacterium]|nr:UDP-N-acetylmuramate dehydrogenase [Candidatus Hippobium faecium]
MTNIFSDLNIPGNRILCKEPLKNHTSFGIGGCADYFIYVSDLKALSATVKYLNENSVPYMVIGDGTNLLVSDHNINKVFIKLEGNFKKTEWNGSFVTAGSAVRLSELTAETLAKGFGGLERIGSVPGSVGGAAVMNAGVRTSDFSTHIHEIGVMDKQGNQIILPKENCGYSYRESIFQNTNDYIITHATFKLIECDTAPLNELLAESIAKRQENQPKGKSAGCFFKNTDGQSSGQLIEQCGLKNYRINGAYVSDKHANFIMNDGTATAEDVLALANFIKKTVKEKKNKDLVFEVRIID